VLEAVDFDARGIVTEVCDLVSDKVTAKGLELTTDVNGLPPVLHGDGLRLRQVLLNFLSNAVKFTEHGRIHVRGRVTSSSGDVTRIRFEVSDTGIGITPEQRARLFRPFEQADASTTRKYGGTGLGLVISRRLVMLMGGEVGCESEPGSGSTFWFEAPFRQPSGEARPSTTSEWTGAEQACAALAHRRKFRILLAEDNELNSAVAIDLLLGVGFQVDWASDGRAAVACAESQRYDLVLMDIQMPDINGLEATRRIRGFPEHIRTPILAMSASASDSTREECRTAGMDDYVAKPVEPQTLYRMLLKWLPGGDAIGPTALTSAIADAPTVEIARPIDPTEFRERMAELRRSLERDELAASELWKSLRPAVRATNDSAAERLGRQIESFAFAEALRTLDELESELPLK
jgi:two-component system, sensor histidine kinase and response regulator